MILQDMLSRMSYLSVSGQWLKAASIMNYAAVFTGYLYVSSLLSRNALFQLYGSPATYRFRCDRYLGSPFTPGAQCL
jgi:hypothetical protein